MNRGLSAEGTVRIDVNFLEKHAKGGNLDDLVVDDQNWRHILLRILVVLDRVHMVLVHICCPILDLRPDKRFRVRDELGDELPARLLRLLLRLLSFRHRLDVLAELVYGALQNDR